MSITLKAARINKGMKQKEAAKALGIAVDTLSKYERGVSFPSVPAIRRIENLYGIPYNEIIFLPETYDLIVEEEENA